MRLNQITDVDFRGQDLPARPEDSSVYPDAHGSSIKDDIPGMPPKTESVAKPPTAPKHDNSTAEAPSGGAQKSPGDEENYHPAELHPAEAE